MTALIIFLAIVYLVPAILMWRYIHLSYSENGQWNAQDAEFFDILCTLVPFLNILACLIFYTTHPLTGQDRKPIRINLNKFFGIKR